ncbi:MAG: glycoside hydrolase family 36 protein [Armatimonadia bacterium]
MDFSADQPAFSFAYDSVPFEVSEWQVEAAANGWTYRHPSGLTIAAEYRRFDSSEAIEVLLRLTNEGAEPTGIISELQPVDISLPVSGGAGATLHHARGSLCKIDDFEPLTTDLPQGGEIALEPNGGRSSNGVLPFMNLQGPEGGLVVAVGWSGQWRAVLSRGGEAVRLAVGMARTHFRLQPGETVRTPRVLLVPWRGEQPATGQNLLRQLILKHYSPLDPDGNPCLPPLSHNTMMTYYSQGTTNEREMLKMLQRCAELGLEAFWIDACWYGTVGNSKNPEDGWAPNAGNWFYNRQNFPDGLARIGEAVAAEGMDFVVWFEPERVYTGSMIDREHPEFVLKLPDNPTGLFDLGRPEAREYLVELISGFISDAGITIYRQDFNMDPLAFWQAAEAPDRVGVNEMKYVAGLYDMWDELRRRHPGLRIDNCSSGGRRIDLETVARSYPLWRSDFSDAGGPSHGQGLAVADQVVNGLSAWVPLHGGAVWSAQPYPWRSAMATGASLYGDIRGDGFPMPLTRQALEELRRLRPLMLADYYRLTPTTTDMADWSGYQFHDPESGSGFAMFFRRPESPRLTREAGLQALEPEAQYTIVARTGYEETSREVKSGKDLAEIMVTIAEAPGSVLLEYVRL